VKDYKNDNGGLIKRLISKKLGKTQSFSASQLSNKCPSLKSDGLKCGFSFVDGQMDDNALGLWAGEQCIRDGVSIHENSTVEKVDGDGSLWINGDKK
jgi:glycerol-3-phosphate dehydrogenase